MIDLLTEVRNVEKEGFASDAQRRAAFASGYKAKGKKGKKEETELDEKFTKKDFQDNESANNHTENGVKLVNMYGTPAEKKLMAQIAKNHEKRGSIIPKEQFLRDRLVKKYYPKLEEVELDEAMKYNFMVLDRDGRVMGMTSGEKDAERQAKGDNIRGVTGRVVKLRKPMAQTRGDRLIGMLPADNLGEALDKEDEPKVKGIIKKLKKASDAHAGQASDLEKAINEDGHVDVASAVRQCKTIVEDATQMMSKLQSMSPEDSLPTWWTNKLAVASNSMNKMRDYLLVPSVSEGVELDETIEDELGENLKKAKKLMAPSKNKEQGIEFVMKGLKVSKDDATRMVNKILGVNPKTGKIESLDEVLPAVAVGAMRAAPAVAKVLSRGAGAPVGAAASAAVDKVKSVARKVKKKVTGEEVEVIEGYFPEAKSSTGYDLYHNDFSSAMQHAYNHAKKKFGITIDKREIDDKVATGPRKPSKGMTNSYRLKGDKGNVRIQVYNMGNKFELNMYKEEVELDENGFVVGKIKMPKMKGGAKLQSKTNFDFRLFDPEDSPGSDKANDEMNREIVKASKMKDKEAAMAHMMKIQKKHSKHGATDTEPREVISQVLNRVFGESVDIDEKFSITLPPTRGGKKLLNIDMGRAIRLLKDFGATKSDMRHALSGKGGRFQNAGGEMFLVQREGVELDEAKYEVQYTVGSRVGDSRSRTKSRLSKIDIDARSKDDAEKKFFKQAEKSPMMKDAMRRDMLDVVYVGLKEELEEKKRISPKILNLMKVITAFKQEKPGSKERKNMLNFINKELKAMGKQPIEDDGVQTLRLGEGYESEVLKVLRDADIEGYFKNNKLYISKRDARDAKKALEDSDEITKLPKMVMEEVDPADVDITATDKDVENASKNIILQLRKVITLRGIKPVVFASGKEKVNPNIAQKALSIHQGLRRTDEKDAFQRKIARSYKDLLNAVKGR